jgi:hypothetical protein
MCRVSNERAVGSRQKGRGGRAQLWRLSPAPVGRGTAARLRLAKRPTHRLLLRVSRLRNLAAEGVFFVPVHKSSVETAG